MQALLFFLQAHNLCLGFVEFYAKLAGKFEFEKRDIFKCPRTFCHRKTQIQNNCRFLKVTILICICIFSLIFQYVEPPNSDTAFTVYNIRYKVLKLTKINVLVELKEN